MRSSSHPLGTEEDWQRVVKYAVARVRQAVEFRQAACGSSILTSPLALYYSFLNMTRGFLALRQERLPAPDHGLKYHGDSDLLSNSASLRKGTFQDYLDALGARRHSALRISLEDALSRIIELFPDYSILRKEEDQLCVPVRVEAWIGGHVCLRFPHYLTDFRSKWESDFPTLPEVCTLEPEGNILRVKDTVDTGSQEAVSSFCVERLEADLVLRDVARWYLVRQVQPELVLPRPSYYFIALFILGSIVRYQPEVILGASSPYSQLGWLLGRLVGLAQRFYPQLMLRWLYGREIYF